MDDEEEDAVESDGVGVTNIDGGSGPIIAGKKSGGGAEGGGGGGGADGSNRKTGLMAGSHGS